MSDHAEASLPMVTVTLPGGRQVDGILQARRQLPDGTWMYDVTLPVPAAACSPLPGEDYGEVPIHLPPAAEPEWTIAPLGRSGGPEVVHHMGRCFVPTRRDGRTVSREQAREAIDGGTEACSICRPDP